MARTSERVVLSVPEGGTHAAGTERMVRLYQQWCAAEGCRVNSALVRSIQNCGNERPLERLLLSNNYFGPKGLRPVIRLIDEFQTMTEIDMEGNGADNSTVEALCGVLWDHLGVTSISLRGNPITVVGGRHLLELVEHNPRITNLDVSNTDVFVALQERIASVVTANRQRALHGVPQLIGNTEGDVVGGGPRRPSVSLPLAREGKERPTLEPIARTSNTAATATTAIARQISPAAGTAEAAAPLAQVTKPQPRPPPPSLAAKHQHSSRLPSAQLRSMRDKYAERARIATEVQRSEASRSANQARLELMALERGSRPRSSGQRGSATPILPTIAAVPMCDFGGNSSAAGVHSTAAATEDGGESFEGSLHGSHGIAFQTPSAFFPAASSATDVLISGAPRHSMGSMDGTMPITAAGGGGGDGAANGGVSGGVEPTRASVAITRRLEDLLDPQKLQLLTTAEQFQLLFDHGCVEYTHGDKDAAYMAWNEAMRIAVARKNREWMSVVSSNLHRLSYEILAEEGMTHLGAGDLEEADKAFELALGVATQSHNAAWKAAMLKARRGVQRALFHRCHEAALLMLDRAQQLVPQELTEDDCFVIPGTELLVSHTERFVTEWARVLHVQEAVRMWAESSAVAERVGGTASDALHESVADALSSVAAFLVQHLFDSEVPSGLSWQGTGCYHYYECVMLSEVWADVLQCVEKQLRGHPLLKGVVATQLGHLYLATYQLSLAQTQFESAVASGRILGCVWLEATGLTFGAIVHWQRADYAVAERQLIDGAGKWEIARKEEMHLPTIVSKLTASLNATGETDMAIGSSGSHYSHPIVAPGDSPVIFTTVPEAAITTTTNGTPDHLRGLLPPDYADLMINVSSYYRVSLMASTHRYTEALEALEEMHIRESRDTLFEKMEANFTTQPTLDHIVAISRECRSPLIYYFLSKRFHWSVEHGQYDVEESVLMWVLPQSPELRFVEINVTRDFRTSVTALLQKVRSGLHLDPINAESDSNDGIILTLHRAAWIEPLQQLYAIFVYPILDYLRAMDPQFNRVDGVLTIVPAGSLWLVPFNALMCASQDGAVRYLVEDVAVQLAFSATQCAFSCLSAQRVRQRGLRRDVVAVQPAATDPLAGTQLPVRFPFNPARSTTEGEQIVSALQAGKVAIVRERGNATTEGTGAVLANSEVVVDDLATLRAALPKARLLHVANSTTCAAASVRERGEGNGANGGICVVVNRDTVTLLHAFEVWRMELFAELVALSNTNISPRHVCGTRDDVLVLLRSFFSGGVPCAVVGQWCTPDMQPLDLFIRFYACQYKSRGAVELGIRAATTPSVASEPRPMSLPDAEVSPMRYRAVCLAHAMRSLLREQESMRYTPRAWAGYHCVGHSFF